MITGCVILFGYITLIWSMHPFTHAAHQIAGGAQLLQRLELAATRGNQEGQGRVHDGHSSN
jgi:hypothetical protein